MLKQIDPKTVSYDGVDFAIYPFPAMTAAMVSGDLVKFFGPIVASALPLLFGAEGETEEEVGNSAVNRLFSMSNAELMPAINTALSTLDGESVQKILHELLIKHGNISCEYEDDHGELQQTRLTQKVLDEIFIGHLDSMIFLAIDVVRLNFHGFFTNLVRQFGNQLGGSTPRTSKSTENSTDVVSVL